MAKPEPFEVPLEMRAYAATTVDQARKAFEDFMTTARQTVAGVDAQSQSAVEGAAEINRRMLGAAEENVAAAFALAHSLVQARTVDEVIALQSAYLNERMAALRELTPAAPGGGAARTTGEADGSGSGAG